MLAKESKWVRWGHSKQYIIYYREIVPISAGQNNKQIKCHMFIGMIILEEFDSLKLFLAVKDEVWYCAETNHII